MCVFVLYVCCTVCGRIGGDGVVKVSDFGLAAKLNPGHNQYLRPPGASARVPIKWMAPESIEHRGLFSEKTDVVSKLSVTALSMRILLN